MKDNFSRNSKEYCKYRPTYPAGIFDFIKVHLPAQENVWDCGTGNGQVGVELSKFFTRVEATDISKNQIKHAPKKNNIHYSIQPAEKTNFSSNQFDLIICAQAVHWFDFNKFYREVKRCLKPEGLIIILGYGLFRSNHETNEVIANFYNNIIGSFWDEERKYLEDEYKTIPFPFKELPAPKYVQTYQWEIEHLLGYLRTWSAVKHYEEKYDQDPVAIIEPDLRRTFGKKNEVLFPILFRMGKIE